MCYVNIKCSFVLIQTDQLLESNLNYHRMAKKLLLSLQCSVNPNIIVKKILPKAVSGVPGKKYEQFYFYLVYDGSVYEAEPQWLLYILTLRHLQ